MKKEYTAPAFECFTYADELCVNVNDFKSGDTIVRDEE